MSEIPSSMGASQPSFAAFDPARYYALRERRWQSLIAQPQADPAAAIDYLGLMGSHERLAPLLALWQGEYLSGAALNRVLADWWSSAGYPSEATATTIVRMFADAGYVTDRPGTERPSAPLVVYRGGSVIGRRGVCWTTELRVARFFAFRFGTAGRAVYSAVVPPHGILGQFFERQEAEVLVNPRTLRQVTTLEQPTIAEQWATGLAEGEREGAF